MIKSMTGYGKAETVSGKHKITVEVRSLNSKQLDLSVKLPSLFRGEDYRIRNIASKQLQRGKADIYVNVEAVADATEASINKSAFANYYRQLREVAAENGIALGECGAEVVSALLRMPEVVASQADEVSQQEAEALFGAVESALDAIDLFRRSEGKILIDDIMSRIEKIESLLLEVESYEAVRTETIKARIREKIDAVGVPVDANRLEQEMIFYVEKLDITEEKVRLANHCRYFREVAAGEEAPGRKLGFIGQEIGREINTLGSKANDASMQRIVVGMKDELEKIKEQLLNIL